MEFSTIDFKKFNKYTPNEIFEKMCNIENNIARLNKRQPVTVSSKNGINTPFYDMDKNEIVLPRNLQGRYLVKLLVSTCHESEHANQELSPLKTENEKMLIAISNAVYPEITNYDTEPLSYICNYKEMCARLAEAKFLLQLYKSVVEQTTLMRMELAQDFRNTIEDTYEHLKVINDKGIKYMQKFNKNSFKKNEYNRNYVNGLSQKEILKFLKRKAPRLYKNTLKEIKNVEKELLKIKQELNLQYIVNLSETSSKISKFNKQESARQHDETDKMQTNGIIAYVHSMPKGEFEENTFDYFDDFKEFVEKAIDSGQADKVYVDIDWNSEIFKTYIQSKGTKTLADEILNNNYVPEITTNRDEIDVCK